jgi:hypothetical protein
MNKEQIIDEAYKNYWDTYPNAEKTFQYEGSTFETRRMTKDEFINKCKTDPEFSKTWGLKIEERELDMMERWAIADLTPNMEEFDFANYMCDKHNAPTKLITITYKDNTIESYE